mgnify:CR=1 FL=1
MSDVLVVYYTTTGNTEMLAEAFKEGIEAAGKSVDLKKVSDVKPSDIEAYDTIAFGCPACGTEELDDTEFEPFFSQVETQLSGKKVTAFGCYGWGDGEFMRTWISRLQDDGATVYGEGFICLETPDSSVLDEAKAYAGAFIAN